MFWKYFNIELNIYNTRMYGAIYPNGTGITKSLVDAFLCTDGKPISVSDLFGGHGDLENEANNRDPRFYQTIWTQQAPWATENGETTTWDDGIYSQLYSTSKYSSTTAYVLRKGFDRDVTTHSATGEDTPAIILRYAEILLNYAEAKAELGTITQEDIDISIKLLRDRVGMPNIILSDIITDPDWHFPDLSAIINEVRRESRIELNNEGHRWHNIARWAAADELIIGKRPKGFMIGDKFPDNNYPVDNSGFLDPYQSSMPDGYGFVIGRDYLDYIGVEQTSLNPALGQNPGW
jgi:starch-binding outer membrane protein, SusD/RagB family